VSTQINVTVGSGGLSDKARQLQTAARQAQLEKERQQRIETQGQEQRTANLAAAGRAPDGSPLFGPGFRQPEVERRPAANRSGNVFLAFYFPTQPVFDITLTSVGAINPTLIGFMDADGPVFKGRNRTSLTHNLFAQFISHTPSLVFYQDGGPYNQASLTHLSPPVPPASAATAPRFSWVLSPLGEVGSFSEITLEADFANGDNNSDLEHEFLWSDPTTGGSGSANYILNRLGGTLVFSLVFNGATLASFSGTFTSDQLMKVDLTHWHRYGLCITQNTAFFCVDGVEIARVNYAPLNSAFTASTASMRLRSITESCRLSAVGFAPKALYSGSYSPRTLLR
jgi:hypothetical protein